MIATLFPSSRAFATVNTDALRHNYQRLEAAAPSARLIAVVKANAYGHGVAPVVGALLDAGCRDFAVATVDEAHELRALAPDASILILGYTPPERASELARAHLVQTVFSREYARALSAHAGEERVGIHLKIDGGMCRLGFAPDDIEGILAAAGEKGLLPLGLYTHFPSADSDAEATLAAHRAFLACRAALAARGLSLFAHTAASPALLALPQTVADGARPGLALYGISPVEGVSGLRPVMSLFAPIVQIHEVPAGTPVGYGGDFVTERPSRIGTLPIGYADGFWRAMRGFPLTLLSGGGEYTVSPAGRICMDQTMVDLTDTPARVGDRICLWSDASRPAAHVGTIPYEILTAVSPRVERLVIGEQEKK